MFPPKLKDVKYNEIEDIYYYTSFTDIEKEYLVMCHNRYTRKNWTCTCYDYMFRKKDCKHITRVRFIDELRISVDRKLPQNKGLLHE